MEIRVRADNLTEEIRSKADIDSFVIGFMIYGVEGLIMTVTNFPVVFAIAMYKQLREQKEFVIVAGLALADGLYGFGFLIAAFGRIIAIEQGNGFVLVSRWDCSLKIWNIIWLISNPLAGLMLLVISIDRLLAVSIPFRYFTFTSRYAFKLVAAVYTFVMFPALLSTYLSYQFQAPEYPAYCFTSYGMHSYYYRYFTTFHLVTSFSSVILYGPVLLQLRRTLKVKNDMSSSNEAKMARLKKVTTAVGVNVLFTFLFNMIPDLLILLCKFENQTPLFILLNGNAMVNMVMFTYRFKEIRQGLKSLVRCRSLIVSSNIGPTAAVSYQKPMVSVSQKSFEFAGNRSLKE